MRNKTTSGDFNVDVEARLNELAMLLMMVEPGDETGIAAISEMLDRLLAAAGQARDEVLQRELLELKNQLKRADDVSMLSLVKAFVNRCQNGTLTNNSSADSSALPEKDDDIGEYFDPEFLVDFIEKHNLLLDEFEEAIVSFRFNDKHTAEDETKLGSFLKSYLHNIKGDAGSIGLIGIEKVTHSLEDIILEKPAKDLLEQLLLYKEWVKGCLHDFAEKRSLREKAPAFLTRLLCLCEETVTNVSQSPTTENKSSGQNTYTITGGADLISEFIAEAEDHLTQIESLLLEKSDFTADDIGKIFRGVHSLKGASSYFNLIEIKETSHKLENILDEVRDEKRPFTPELVQLTLTYVDIQKKLLNAASEAMSGSGNIEKSADVSRYLGKLADFTKSDANSSEGVVQAEMPKDAAIAHNDNKLNIKTYIKVDTQRLDRLVDAVGEMVIYSSMLVRQSRELLSGNEAVLRTSSQVEKFSRELQDIGMSMRLDPIRSLFQKMSRLVWDVSKKLRKEVSFQMTGEDTELDRTVIERLADPLMHMVRNALDHGIEMPEERVKAGKPRAGALHLSAYQAGGNIMIEIRDDGCGLDPVKLRRKALEKGLITESDKLMESEVFALIMRPGFSTAEKVTDISGRGVGMDVARSNIESLRGRIRIDSKVGLGTTFTIELPLTLAIVDGIEIVVGRERFIIPTLSVIELINPTQEMVTTTMGKGECFCFRGAFLPFYRLARLYGLTPTARQLEDGVVAIVETGGQRAALYVDCIVGSCQTVIKSLGEVFRGNQGLAGCSIMPDGEIGLILDVSSLVTLARNEYEWRLEPAGGTKDSAVQEATV